MAGNLTAILPSVHHEKDEIEDVVDDQVVSTRGGGYHKFLIKWKGSSLNDYTWITELEFQRVV